MTKTIISERVYNQNQSWYFEHTVLVNEGTTSFKLRVAIRRNAYDNQSYAHVDMWNGNEWKRVLGVPITECVCKSISYTDVAVTKTAFVIDSNKLLLETCKIVL